MKLEPNEAELQRLSIIQQQSDSGALTDAVSLSPEPGPTAVLIISSTDPLALSLGIITTEQKLASHRRYEETGEELTFAVASSVGAIADLLRQQGYPDVASGLAEVQPPDGRTWVVCVAAGKATVAAIRISQRAPIGTA